MAASHDVTPVVVKTKAELLTTSVVSAMFNVYYCHRFCEIRRLF
jgi:hypothetical protein